MKKENTKSVIIGGNCKMQTPSKTAHSGNAKIKVTVHIPDSVPRKQEKINRIYDLLKPKISSNSRVV